MDQLRVLGRAAGPYGELVLRERLGGPETVHELIVNGVFAMDSTEISSERELARLVRSASSSAPRVLVGGLGLGYTTAALLADHRVEPRSVDVVELEPSLVAWARSGLTPVLGAVASDPRVRLHVGDIGTVLWGSGPPAGPWDAILLDVDNGPDFLIHSANAALYTPATLRAAYDGLVAGGVLAVWCQAPAPDLLTALQALGPAAEHRHEVVRDGHRFSYAIYTLHRLRQD